MQGGARVPADKRPAEQRAAARLLAAPPTADLSSTGTNPSVEQRRARQLRAHEHLAEVTQWTQDLFASEGDVGVPKEEVDAVRAKLEAWKDQSAEQIAAERAAHDATAAQLRALQSTLADDMRALKAAPTRADVDAIARAHEAANPSVRMRPIAPVLTRLAPGSISAAAAAATPPPVAERHQL